MDIDPRSLRQRLAAVPLTIRTKMGLDETTDKVIAIKEKFHIDPENGILAQLILRMMIEDLAPQYFAWELKDALKVDSETAKKISTEVRDKVLAIAKDDFKKVAIDVSLVGAMEEPPKPVAGTIPKPAPAAINVGNAPVAPTPIPKIPSVSVPQAAPKGAPATPAAPITPAPPTPAPFMMHQETVPTPVVAAADFKLNIPKDMFKSTPSRPVEIPRPPKPAELEIGKMPPPPKPPTVVSFRPNPTASSRVIHYTDLRTIVNPAFGPAQPAVTPPVAPKPPASSVAAPIPKVPPAPVINPTPKISLAPAVSTPAAQVAPAPTQPKPPKVVNFGPEEVK